MDLFDFWKKKDKVPPKQRPPSPQSRIEHKGLSFTELPFDRPAVDDSLSKMPASARAADDLYSQKTSAVDAYRRGIRTMKRVLDEIQLMPIQAYAELQQVSETFLALLKNRNQILLPLTTLSTSDDYLCTHSVNVAILSLQVGLGIHARTGQESVQKDRDQLILMGIAALLNDIGMLKWLHLARQPRILTPEERSEVQLHPLESAKLLNHIEDVRETTKASLAAIIGKLPETRSGKEHPINISGNEEIIPAPQIIELCDIYEAMSHPRPWRKPMLAHEVVKAVINHRHGDFNIVILKAFLEQLSLYPPGSFVELSSREICRTMSTNANSPNRPIVEIWVQENGQRQDPPLLLDLAANPLIHIVRAVDESAIDTSDEKLIENLRALRRWVE